jgi:hypothetical protein
MYRERSATVTHDLVKTERPITRAFGRDITNAANAPLSIDP